MSGRAFEAATAAILEPAADERAWWRSVLAALAGPMRATLGLAYGWGPQPGRGEHKASLGDERVCSAVAAALLALPPRWLAELHEVHRGYARLAPRLERLPPRLRRTAQEVLAQGAGEAAEVFVLVPQRTSLCGTAVLLATPRACLPGPRTRAALGRMVGYLSAALALRHATLGRDLLAVTASRPRSHERVWRELLDGGWSVVRTERSAAGNGMLLVRSGRRAGNDPRALTFRERQVMELTLEGRGNKWIAWQMGVATATVATHLRTGIGKLGLRSRAELFTFFGAGASG